MPQKNKVAKKRLDKFYYLAKERGYRSRAAFKLLQLDKKYDFLSKARGVLDLCAAPGSWMQVARQHMPSTAPCIGIDLAAIKPINKCVGLQEDITTQKCRSAIRHELKEHKVDVVLHDGAPNVGTAWLQDAFGQNELTLHALRLACDFMQPGGTFVTKAFRSQDYNSLLFVFEQLFRRVEATKPSASRNESAEIFVVCQGFTKAAIDPKFLDPKYVFKELEVAVDESTNVLQRRKNFKAPAVGYSQNGKQLLTSDLSVSDFVTGAAPVKALGEHNRLVWDDSPECEAWRGMAQTTSALYEACNDLKVLGKKDFRMLLTWRLKAAELWRKLERANGGGGKKGRGEEGSGEEESGEEGSDEEGGEEAAEATIDGELTELERLAAQRKKAAKRKESEKRRRMRERLSLQMEHPGDRLDFGEDLELFSLNKIKSAKALKKLGYDASADFTAEDDEREDDGNGMGDDGESDDEEDYIAKLDRELNAMYADFQSRSKRRAVAQIAQDQEEAPKSKKQRRKEISEQVEAGDKEDEFEVARRVAAANVARRVEDDSMDDDDDDDDDDDKGDGGASTIKGGGYGRGGGFDVDSADDDDEGDEDDDEEGGKKRGGKNPLIVSSLHKKPSKSERDAAAKNSERAWFAQGLFAGLDGDDDEEEVVAMAEAARERRAKRMGNDGGAEAAAGAGEAVGAGEAAAAAAGGGKKAKRAANGKAAAAPPEASANGKADAAPKPKPFIKATAFEGARPGCVFKKGAKGLGYYADAVEAAKAEAKAGAKAEAGAKAGAKAGVKAGAKAGAAAATASSSSSAAAKASAAAAAQADTAAASATGATTTTERKRKRGPRGGSAGSTIEEVVPDNSRYVDDGDESGPVGGKKVQDAVAAEEEEELDRDQERSREESLQASIEKQAEAIVLGQMLLNPVKRRQLEDAAYNRHTRNDRNLPQWFLDDERKFASAPGYGLELDENMLEKARNGLKDITARSIGKVAEAKGRKMRRMQRALTKLRKKANAVVNKEDLSEREKAREVQKLYNKKVNAKERKRKTLVIGRPFEAGSSGKKAHGVKMVDRRLKNDMKAEKAAAKTKKGSRTQGKAGGGGGGGGSSTKSKGNRQHKSKAYKRTGRK